MPDRGEFSELIRELSRLKWYPFQRKSEDDLRNRFVDAWIEYRICAQTLWLMWVIPAFHLTGVVICATVMSDQPGAKIYTWIHAVCFVLTLCICLEVAFKKQVTGFLIWSQQIFAIPMYYVLMHFVPVGAGNLQTLAAMTGIVAVLFVGVFFSGTTRHMAYLALSFVATNIYAFGLPEIGYFYGTTFFLTAAFALTIIIILRQRHYAEAQLEFDRRVATTPRQLVQAFIDDQHVTDPFPAKQRECVCIASDWRGYQKMSANLESHVLAELLGAYYEQAETLLSQTFPEGNYFSDWIADELFIVAFPTASMTIEQVAEASVTFGRHLITSKDVFASQEAIDLKIDLGFSRGQAYIGMLGPKNHRKATALGETAGVARRLQTVGKELRQKFGEQDRLVIDQALAACLSNPAQLTSIRSADVDLRDYDSHEFFVVAPNAGITLIHDQVS